MSSRKGAAKPEMKMASEDEVEEAIRGLSKADLYRLKAAARFRSRNIGARRGHCGPDDLLQEAIVRTLDGTRHWIPARVSFFQYLLGAIKSIANHWPGQREGARGDPSKVEATCVAAHHLHPAARLHGLERQILARDELATIRNAFNGDDMVQQIIDGLSEEMTGPEIQEVLGITQTQLETAMKRLRRKARSLFDYNGGHDA
jgi:DNA-directed RNA polymerase specialized sigma24 family protein